METMRSVFVFFPFFEDAEKRAVVEGFTAREEENIICLRVCVCVRKVVRLKRARVLK